MITRFRVKNYKALRDVTIHLTPMHVLIGPNDSGKTSVLEAMAALSRAMDRRLADAFAGPWEGRELVWRREAGGVVELTADVKIADTTAEYCLTLRFSEKGREVPYARQTLASPPGSVGVDVQIRLIGQSSLTDDSRRPSNDGQPAHLAVEVREALSGVQYYRWNPRFLSLPVAPDAARQFQMDPSGFGLALVLDDILGYDRERFTALESRFRQMFPDIKSIKLLREMGYQAPGDTSTPVPMLRKSEGKGLHFELGSSKQIVPAAQVSDGVLLILAYLTVLYLPEPPRLLLVEEPENGIHPKRVEEVLGLLRQLVQEHSQTQIVMTTHSPYVVDLFKPEEVTLCRRDAEGATVAHRLSDSKTVREQLDVFSLGEIWTGEGEENIIKSEIAATEGRA